jgi:hypothetical protein
MPIDETSELPDSIIESIAISNVKAVAGQPAMLSNLAFANLVNNVNLSQQNAVSHQQAMNQLLLTVTGKVVNLVANLSPLEAEAATHLFTGNEAAEDLADLKAADEDFSPPQSTDESGGETGGE